jgi:hypothetical protein
MMYRAAASALQAEPAYGDNDELRSEAELLASLGTQALGGDASRVAKFSTSDRHYKSTKRGRGSAALSQCRSAEGAGDRLKTQLNCGGPRATRRCPQR